jgi:hypothetical protein
MGPASLVISTAGPTPANLQVAAMSVSGASQTSGFEVFAHSGTGAASSISTSVTPLTAGAWGFDVVGTAGTITTLNANAGQTQRQQQDNTQSDVAISTKVFATTAPSSMGWTFNASATNAGHVIGVWAPAPGGGSPPGPRDIRTKVVKITSPGSTGNTAITGVGFQGKGAFFWGVPVQSTAVAVDAAQWLGIVDNLTPTPRQKSVMVAGQNGVANTRRAADGANAISILRADNDTPVVVGRVVSWNADGFTVNFTTVSAGYVIYALVFGGSDLSTFVGETAASAGAVTGVTFSPDIGLAITFCDTLGNAGSAPSTQSFGAFDRALNKWWVGSYQGSDAAAQNQKDSVLRTTGFLGQLLQGAIAWELSPTAVTADGFTWSGTNTDGFFFLLLGFNGGRATVGTFTKTTSAAPALQTLPDPGWKPQAYILASAVKNSQAIGSAPGTRVAIGAFAGSGRQESTLRTDVNNAQNADQRANDDKVLGLGSTNAAYDALATAHQIVNDTPELEWNPNDANARIIGFVEVEVGTTNFVEVSVLSTATSSSTAQMVVTGPMSALVAAQSSVSVTLTGGVPFQPGELLVLIDAASVETTGTALTTVLSHTIPLNTAIFGTVEFGARNEHVLSELDTFSIDFMATAHDGLVAQSTPAHIVGRPGWNVILDNGGPGVIRARVQGPSGVTLRWSCVLRAHEVFQVVSP